MSKLRTIITRSLLATTALVFATSNALAGTDTDPQSITATVAGACTVVVQDVDFGAVTGTAKVTFIFDVTVACTVKPIATTGTLEANAGAHFGSGTRNVEGAVGSPKPLMAYEIFLGISDITGTLFGDTGSGATHPGATTSVALSETDLTLTSFAAVLTASGGPRPEGVFADTVTWTLTF